MRTWELYKNGNYTVKINTRNGTKIRETEEDDFRPEFAENVDVMTSTVCDHGCAFCYAGCSKDGKHADLLEWKFLNTLHPYTEMALNLNWPMPPNFIEFLEKLKSKNVIANITVNQDHFEKHSEFIKSLIDQKLVYGIGISLVEATDNFIDLIQKFPTAIIHTINGVTKPADLEELADHGLKILILGYKDTGRGVEYHENKKNSIATKQKWLYDNLQWLTNHFNVVSFDNLALEQLDVKRILTEEEWNEFYMGDDGSATFAINLVDGVFSRNSLAKKTYPIMDNIDDMFNIIRKECAA